MARFTVFKNTPTLPYVSLLLRKLRKFNVDYVLRRIKVTDSYIRFINQTVIFYAKAHFHQQAKIQQKQNEGLNQGCANFFESGLNSNKYNILRAAP